MWHTNYILNHFNNLIKYVMELAGKIWRFKIANCFVKRYTSQETVHFTQLYQYFTFNLFQLYESKNSLTQINGNICTTGADLLVCLFALLTSNSKTNFNQFCRLGGSSVRHLSYPGHGPVTTVSWSPSGQLLVSGSPADSNLMVGFTVFIYLHVSQWLWRGRGW